VTTIDLAEMNWMQVQERLKRDTRVVIPLGATEEHGYLSVMTDALFVDAVTAAACRNADVLRMPVIPLGCSAFAVNFPGTLSVRTVTMCHVVEDIIDGLYRQGFRRVAFVTGHGGNEVITGVLSEAQMDRPGLCVYYKNAWDGSRNIVASIDAGAGNAPSDHGSWHESFSFTRTTAIPAHMKPLPDGPDFPLFPLNPRTARAELGDGVVGGAYTAGDESTQADMLEACVARLYEFLASLPLTGALQ
jgi:creatinine amidohydrolase